MTKVGKIITANDWFKMNFLGYRRSKMLIAMRHHGLPGDFGVDEKKKPLKAFVNHGRWLVICPHCGGGEKVWEEGLMMCFSCFNSYIGHKLRKTSFPKYRRQIEELLILRPLDNRNWELNEKVEDLERENAEHAEELLPVKGG